MSKHLFQTVGLAVASIMATAPALGNEVNVPLKLYVGAGITQSRFDARTFSVDNKDKSGKAITGWRFHDYVALELDCVDFGKAWEDKQKD